VIAITQLVFGQQPTVAAGYSVRPTINPEKK
jgi:hypothetical protein